ncbi:MAG: hypothetical protein CMO55_27845 [Verrucomicrobiales bacterium]|nr:hypothetical protein [Verrucomicrobiales bacterium]
MLSVLEAVSYVQRIMKEVELKAGEKRIVVKRQFSSVPMEYHFQARPADPSLPLKGQVSIDRNKIFSHPPVENIALREQNSISAGFWDTFVTVTVQAEEDLIVSSKRIPGKSILPILLIALLVTAIAAAISFLTLF